MTTGLLGARVLRFCSVVALAGLSACSEPTTAPAGRGADAAARGARTALLDYLTPPTSTTGFVRFAPWAPPLETYNTSFVYTVGWSATLDVRFKGTSLSFLRLVIPRDAVILDASGRQLARGDTVRITLAIDSVTAGVQFGPHGAQFSGVKPAQLYLNYYFLDLGGLAPTNLAIWYQPDATAPWTILATEMDTRNWWLIANLYHFSNYAVAYRR